MRHEFFMMLSVVHHKGEFMTLFLAYESLTLYIT